MRDPRRPAMLEDQLKASIIDLAEKLRWRVYSIRRSDLAKVQGKTGKGYPDLTLCRAPRIVFVELKSETGKLTDQQARWTAGLEACPHVEVYVWRPRHWTSGKVEELLR